MSGSEIPPVTVRVRARGSDLDPGAGSTDKKIGLNEQGYLKLPNSDVPVRMRVNIPGQKSMTLDEIKKALTGGEIKEDEVWMKIADLTNSMVGQIFDNIDASSGGEFGDKTKITESETRDTKKDVQLVDHEKVDNAPNEEERTHIAADFNALVAKISKIMSEVLPNLPEGTDGAQDEPTMHLQRNEGDPADGVGGATTGATANKVSEFDSYMNDRLTAWNGFRKSEDYKDDKAVGGFVTGIYEGVPGLSGGVTEGNLAAMREVKTHLEKVTAGHEENIAEQDARFVALLGSGNFNLEDGDLDEAALKRIIDRAKKKIAEKELEEENAEEVNKMKAQVAKLSNILGSPSKTVSDAEEEVSLSPTRPLSGTVSDVEEEVSLSSPVRLSPETDSVGESEVSLVLDADPPKGSLQELIALEESLFTMEGEMELKAKVSMDEATQSEAMKLVDDAYETVLEEAKAFAAAVEPFFADVEKDIVKRTPGFKIGKLGTKSKAVIAAKVASYKRYVGERLDNAESSSQTKAIKKYIGWLERARDGLDAFEGKILEAGNPSRSEILSEWVNLRKSILRESPKTQDPTLPLEGATDLPEGVEE